MSIIDHCCGSSEQLWTRFIDIGMDAVQTIQTAAKDMNPFDLKKKYGNKITLYGAIDVQGWLQKASKQEIEAYLTKLIDEVGKDGGFICSPAHFLQPDIPLNNVLDTYRTLLHLRGKDFAF